jgi:hypothetical protein
MSLSLLVDQHADSLVFRTDRFAKTVTHVREGHRVKPSVTVLTAWDAPDQRSTGTRDAKLRGSLHVADSVTVAMSDKWQIDGRTYCTIGIGDPAHGMREVRVEHRQGDIRRDSLGVI